MSDKDIVEEARALLQICTGTPSGKITNGADAYLFDVKGPQLLRALADEVERLRKQAVEDKAAFDELYGFWKKEVGAR